METFLQKYENHTRGILHGFDRIIIKGHIQKFYVGENFYYYLNKENIMLKDFKGYVEKVNEIIKSHIDTIKQKSGCYSEYLTGHKITKEEIAKRILQENPEKEGLLCILSAVEPCKTITVRYKDKSKKLESSHENRKCLHYYFYYNDREFGLMYIRLQTWLPFGIQIYINGNEYLKQQLTKKNISYTSYANSITSVSDIARAQEIADKFVEKKWYKTFDHFAKQVNGFLPRIEEIFDQQQIYTWCIEQCEYASDVLFKDRKTLESVYPYFLEYASLCQMGENIFTFFGRKVHGNYQGEADSDRKNYYGQGLRIKYTLDRNFLKMYDKSSVLRVETTINNSHAFKVYNQGKNRWLPMGKNISNLYRYAEISKKCNERYLESLVNVNRNNDLDKLIEKLCHPTMTKLSEKSVNERHYAALNPLKKLTVNLFNVVMNGAYKIKGFSNKDLIKPLIALGCFTKEQVKNIKKLSAKITREIAKLRAHNLVTKLQKTNRYRVTSKGEEIISRILMFKKLDLKFC